MALTAVNTGDVFYPGVLNQIINVLQRQAGQSDAGKFDTAGNSYTATGLFQSSQIWSRSRRSVPVSVTVDTADDSATNLSGPTVAQITMGGCQVYASGTVATNNCHEAGNCTFNY